jgi:hypothetical protein
MLKLFFFIDHVCDFFVETDYEFQILERHFLNFFVLFATEWLQKDTVLSLICAISTFFRPDL